jgi:hypothetical protein
MIHSVLLTATTTASASTSFIIAAISSVGFPIVMCGALFWYIQKENAANRDKIDKLTDVLSANTAVIAKLLERLDKE